MKNRYFVGLKPGEKKLDKILRKSVSTIDTIRHSLDGKKIIIKLFRGNKRVLEILKDFQELNHKQAKKLMKSKEWSNKEL